MHKFFKSRSHSFFGHSSRLFGICDAAICDDICGLALWTVGRVLDFCYALLAATLAKEDSSSGCVRQDMAADRFAPIGPSEERTGTRIRLHLVGLRDGW